MDPKDTFEILQKIKDGQGNLGLFLFITIIVVIGALMIYLKYSVKSIAEEVSKKAVEEFKSQLNKSLQTQMGLFFRDDNIRNSLLAKIGEKSFDKKIECWQLTQNLYFNYQKSWGFSESTDVKEYVKIDEKLNELRMKVFNETVYIGYDLSQKLIRLNSLMRDGLRAKRTEFAYSGAKYQAFSETKLTNNLNKQSDIETKISDLLYETEKWIMTKLHSDQTIDKFEFTSDQLEKMKSERNKQFEDINN